MTKKEQTIIFLTPALFFIGALGYYFYTHQRAYQNDLYLNEIATIGQTVRDYKKNNSSLPLRKRQLIPISSDEFREIFQTPEPKYCEDCVFYKQEGHFWIFGNIPDGKQCLGTKRKIRLPDGSFSEANFVLQGRKFNCWMGE